jgi:hypothetical protein
VRPSLAHLLILSASQDVKFEFLVKSRVDQVKAAMTYSMKSENKLDGASNFRAWKTRINLILAKNKVLNIVKGKIMEPVFEEGKEKEPQNVAVRHLKNFGLVVLKKNQGSVHKKNSKRSTMIKPS